MTRNQSVVLASVGVLTGATATYLILRHRAVASSDAAEVQLREQIRALKTREAELVGQVQALTLERDRLASDQERMQEELRQVQQTLAQCRADLTACRQPPAQPTPMPGQVLAEVVLRGAGIQVKEFEVARPTRVRVRWKLGTRLVGGCTVSSSSMQLLSLTPVRTLVSDATPLRRQPSCIGRQTGGTKTGSRELTLEPGRYRLRVEHRVEGNQPQWADGAAAMVEVVG